MCCVVSPSAIVDRSLSLPPCLCVAPDQDHVNLTLQRFRSQYLDKLHELYKQCDQGEARVERAGIIPLRSGLTPKTR